MTAAAPNNISTNNISTDNPIIYHILLLEPYA